MTRLYAIAAAIGSSLFLALGSPGVAIAAAPSPSIQIVSPHNGATIRGSSVTVRVRISHFRLLPPKLANPPILKRNEGHIHYTLDGRFLVKGVTQAQSHTWTHLSVGPHTLGAYLATSQHIQYPGTMPATVHILVIPAGAMVRTGGGGGAAFAAPLRPPTQHPQGASISPGIWAVGAVVLFLAGLVAVKRRRLLPRIAQRG
jgi:hypothetical protein